MAKSLIFIASYFFLITLDFIWLGLLAKKLYRQELNSLMRTTPNWLSGAIVYAVMTIGIMCFVLSKANNNLGLAFVWGCLFGAVLYLTYNFTNFTIITGWSLKLSLIDSLWGIFLCGITSVFAVWIKTFFEQAW